MTDENKPVSKKTLQVSKAPPPITPLRGLGHSYKPKPSTNERLPNWAKWKYMPEVELWEACALALNFDPDLMRRSPQNWMVPEVDIFLPESFPSDEVAGEFEKLRDIVEANNLQTVYRKTNLPEFAAWCAPVVRDLTGRDIPPELAALAKVAPQAAPLVEAAPADEPDEKFYTGETNRNGGRYQLAVAAWFIADRTKAEAESMMHKPFEAAGAGKLRVYKRGMVEVYRFKSAPNWKSDLPLSTLQSVWWRLAIPSVIQALRAHERDHYDESDLRRMGECIWRCEDDHGTAG